MEEILFDPSQFSISSEDLASLQEVMTRSKTEGVQVGIPWNKVVYDYMFESGVFMMTIFSLMWMMTTYDSTWN